MDWLKVKNKTDTSADLYFYGDIVSDYWSAWDDVDQYPENIKNFLSGVQDVPNLNIYINSGGGAVFAALAIYSMLKRHPAHKTVYVDGIAASAASLIALAGDKLIMPSHAFLMVHKPLIGIFGNAYTLREYADKLDMWEEGLLNIYKENLADDSMFDELKQLVDAETWLTGEQASKYFNIELVEGQDVVACISEQFKNYKHVPEAVLEHKTSNNDEEVKMNRMKLELAFV